MTRAWGNRRFAGWAWLLVAAVLLLRTAVPSGFMPERAADGELRLTVCGSHGLVQIPVEGERPAQKRAPSHCAFAGIGAADLPPQPVLPQIDWRGQHFAERNAAAQRAAALYPRPPSRGPPAIA